jgi:hypothetical protein
MRVLLDTNILIHREASAVIRDDIGDLFLWLDRIHAEKCIHPHSVEEIRNHQDREVVRSFEAKLRSYAQLRTVAHDTPAIAQIRQSDRTINDSIDTDLLREVFAERVDLLLSEDRYIHAKAEQLGIADRVKRIDSFLEEIVREHPELVEYSVLAVRKEYFGNVDVSDSFFDSFRQDYPNYERWFNRKADEIAYTCRGDGGRILAFLYLKPEGPDEPYGDIRPTFSPKRRLKIGTFRAVLNGYKIGERFLKIVFDNALKQSIDEIYLTIFERTPEHNRLIDLIGQWGFCRHGSKISDAGEESVWVRPFVRQAVRDHPAATYPFISREAPKFIVPIYPQYHTELLPDSILRTESPMDFVENRPNRNAIRKAYISRSHFRDLRSGDIIVFYRTRSGTAPAHYTSVATTIGVVESVHLTLSDFQSFRAACETVTVFTDVELRQHWDYYPRNRPFVVKFLSVYSLPRRPNLSEMKAEGILLTHPRGFEPLTDQGFYRLLEIANATDCPIVD